jgi:L-cysteine S-thiosulfotransferase
MSAARALRRRGHRLAVGFALALAAGASAAQAAGAQSGSGFAMMSPQTQAMQRDDSLNPGLLWVKDGEALWSRTETAGQRSCAGCHGAVETAMRGVAARYPAFDALLRQPLDLAGRINLCRVRHQQLPAWTFEGPELLAVEALLALQSRGLAMSPPADAALAPFRERGAALFKQRFGQLDLSCSSCHDALAGRRLGGSMIPPADPLPYPAYRLQWQSLGSLQRRIRNCMTGVRAEPFAYGDAELIELGLHLASRARGLTVEAPGVRP